jgi:hypothetical protein
MNTLKCSYDKWGSKEVVVVSLKDLYYGTSAPENEEFYNTLLKDITNNQMIDPILVTPLTKTQIDKMSQPEILKSITSKPVDWDEQPSINVVMLGNNRLLIAHELGYDSIDCVFTGVDNLVEQVRIVRKARMENNSEDNVRR